MVKSAICWEVLTNDVSTLKSHEEMRYDETTFTVTSTKYTSAGFILHQITLSQIKKCYKILNVRGSHNAFKTPVGSVVLHFKSITLYKLYLD